MHMAAARHGRQHVALGAGKASRIARREERTNRKERKPRSGDELEVYSTLQSTEVQGVGS